MDIVLGHQVSTPSVHAYFFLPAIMYGRLHYAVSAFTFLLKTVFAINYVILKANSKIVHPVVDNTVFLCFWTDVHFRGNQVVLQGSG